MLQLHLEVNARDNGKPMIIEEFGLTWCKCRGCTASIAGHSFSPAVICDCNRNTCLVKHFSGWGEGEDINSACQILKLLIAWSALRLPRVCANLQGRVNLPI